jgi:hypothetical protein
MLIEQGTRNQVRLAIEVSAEASAVIHDRGLQLAPQIRVHVAAHDAEIVADIDEHRADRAAAHHGGDFLERG